MIQRSAWCNQPFAVMAGIGGPILGKTNKQTKKQLEVAVIFDMLKEK